MMVTLIYYSYEYVLMIVTEAGRAGNIVQRKKTSKRFDFKSMIYGDLHITLISKRRVLQFFFSIFYYKEICTSIFPGVHVNERLNSVAVL